MNNDPFNWNEFQQIGTDYSSLEEVAVYDSRMREFRDIDGENKKILELLQLPEAANLLEIGIGTGSFILSAAPACKNAVGIDVSKIMLEYAESRAKALKLANISFFNCGFLSYEYPENFFDAVVSGLALHHLPDAWKMVALEKIRRSMKNGGRMVLNDVVFDWKNQPYDQYFREITSLDNRTKPHLEKHIAVEFSTLDWIMCGLFEHAGFEIESNTVTGNFLRTYSVIKK